VSALAKSRSGPRARLSGLEIETALVNIDWAKVYERYLRGGIDGWQAAGQTLNPKGTS
jgi:hypothetical protein